MAAAVEGCADPEGLAEGMGGTDGLLSAIASAVGEVVLGPSTCGGAAAAPEEGTAALQARGEETHGRERWQPNA